MKKITFLILFSFCLCCQTKAKEQCHNYFEIKHLKELNISDCQGVSGHFAGISNDALIVAGGCNFPQTPAAQGGKKVFYNNIFVLDKPLSEYAEWQKCDTLPTPTAYGISITTPEGVVCIGGTNGTRSSAQVLLINYQNETIKTKGLTPLPIPLENMAGAYGNGYIYIAGGQSNGKNSNATFRIKLTDLINQKNWEQLPDFPGKSRIQPTAAIQSNANGYSFYLMGGFAPATDSEQCFIHTNGIVFCPKENRWQATSEIAMNTFESNALIGASATTVGNSHIIFAGGVNKTIFERALNRPFIKKNTTENDSITKQINKEDSEYLTHPATWYKFNNELLIYNTITDTWAYEKQNNSFAKAGATMVTYNGHLLLVGGENKPGVRSNEIIDITIKSKQHFGWLNWTVLAIYLLAMLLLGFYFMRKEQGGDDFFKGGGRIPWWAAGISIYATMLSAITYMAYPAKAYATNWTYYPMLITILLVSFPVIKYYLPFFRRLNVTSAYEYLELRFNAITRLMASALFIVFMIARMALVLYLPSLALTAVTGINIYTCIVLMGIVTIVYCTMGGVEAVIWGDVVQGFILVGGALLVAGYLIFSTEGGFNGFTNIAINDHKLQLIDWSFDFTKATFWVVILGGIANNLISYTSDQTVIQRYLTTKDEKSAKHSILMNGIMSVFISVVFFIIGTGLYTFFKTHPTQLDITMAKTDTIFPFFMMSQLPAGVAGLLIAAIFAATMSTISSNINSVATAFSVDFYKRWNTKASDKTMLSVARYTCVISGIIGIGIALLMATWDIYSLLDFFQEILGLLSSGLGGLFIMGIFFPRIDAKSALVGFICGILTVFGFKYFTNVNLLLYGCIGMIISVVVGFLLSFIFHNKKNSNGLTWKHLNK